MISFHKHITPKTASKINYLCESIKTIGLHQSILFAQVMEPNKRIEICVAENSIGEIEGYCIIHKRYPIVFIQDGPIATDEKTILKIILEIKKRYRNRFYAFTTIQLPFFQDLSTKFSDYNSKLKDYFQYPTWASVIIDIRDLEQINKTFETGNLGTNIRKAVKKGVIIESSISESIINEFANLYDETYKSRDIGKQWKNSAIYFKKLLPFLENKNGFFIGAYIHGKLVAGGVFLRSGNTIHYKYGASDRNTKGIPLMHTVIYQAIIKAQSIDVKYFDLCGINLEAPKGSQVEAISNFKRSFGGEVITAPKRIYLNNNTLISVLLFITIKCIQIFKKV